MKPNDLDEHHSTLEETQTQLDKFRQEDSETVRRVNEVSNGLTEWRDYLKRKYGTRDH